MKNVLMGVSYLGTNYAGWQKQDNALAIQELIENALKEVTGENIEIFASGRTDAGVHAMEQCCSFKTKFSQVLKLPIALNSKLPEDIKILWAKEVDENFHARFSAHKKTYLYRLKVDKVESPFDYLTTAYVPYELNLQNMLRAAEFLIGEHNFKAFCSSGTSVPDFTRTIYSLSITQTNNLYEFEICGNGFLYNMVRIIVGTLVDVGRGKISPDQIKEILIGQKRENAGKTMPAKGLLLKNVAY